MQYCRWHISDTSEIQREVYPESWREVYERLVQATPEEKTEIVLQLMSKHPKGRLILPVRDGVYHPDLSKADLSQSTLYRKTGNNSINFRFADLRGANLWHANLEGTDLIGANLEGAALIEANLQGAFLDHAKLVKAVVSRARLSEAKLENADLQGAVLQDADLQHADLTKANLQDALLPGARLQNANLLGANLRGANLQNVALQNADLMGADLQGANLENAELQGTNLHGADLRNTSLGFAILEGADLSWTKLQGVDLFNTNIRHLHVSGAWLERTRVRHEQFGGAIGEETKGSYGEAKLGYLILKQNFDDLGDYEAASWAYIKERQMERTMNAPWRADTFYGMNELGDNFYFRNGRWQREMHPGLLAFYAKHTLKWLADCSVELLCEYGESIGRVLFWMAVLLFIVGPALLGLLAGLDWTDSSRKIYFSFPNIEQRWAYAYLQHILYMLDTFTTANFAQLQPANDAARLFSGFMAIMGIFLAGLLGFVAGNRIRRS
jgi:uncharacterized protein YjbI with pentapeptide repeats